IEGQVELGLWIEQPHADPVEAFRCLPVADLLLGPELARPAADRIGLEKRILAGWLYLPDFEFALFLEDADQHGVLLIETLGLDLARQLRRALRRWRQILEPARAAGSDQNRRAHQHTGRKAADRAPQ